VKTTELTMVVKGHEKRLRKLENAIARIGKELELTELIAFKKDINPVNYAKDDLDQKIIKLLLEKRVLTTSEIASALGDNRHKIGKRLKRIEMESKQAGEPWLEFNPKEKDGHFRAWWVTEEVK